MTHEEEKAIAALLAAAEAIVRCAAGDAIDDQTFARISEASDADGVLRSVPPRAAMLAPAQCVDAESRRLLECESALLRPLIAEVLRTRRRFAAVAAALETGAIALYDARGTLVYCSRAATRFVERRELRQASESFRRGAPLSPIRIDGALATPRIIGHGVLQWTIGEVADDPVAPFADALTARECAVARGLLSGQTRAEIAKSLTISAETVKWYVARIYRKLNVRGRGELAGRAILGTRRLARR